MSPVATTHGSAHDARPPNMVLGGFTAIARHTGFSESWDATFGNDPAPTSGSPSTATTPGLSTRWSTRTPSSSAATAH